MISLILLFTGLCGYSVGGVLESGPHNRVIVNMLRLDSHYSVLVVDKKYIDLSNTTLGYSEAENNEDFLVFNIDGYSVTINPDYCSNETGCVSVRHGLDVGQGVCPKPGNFEDIYWIGKMYRVSKSNGRLCRGCQSGRLERDENARITISRGALRVVDFARTSENFPIRWELDWPPGQSDFTQALADLVEVKQELPTPIRIILEDNNGGKKIIAIKNQHSEVLMEFKNVTEKGICPKPSESNPITIDPHYTSLFRLLHNPVVNNEDLEDESWCEVDITPSNYNLCIGTGAKLNDPQCPGGWFEPSP